MKSMGGEERSWGVALFEETVVLYHQNHKVQPPSLGHVFGLSATFESELERIQGPYEKRK